MGFVCETCGSLEYLSHEGYLYCKECQTQSQFFSQEVPDGDAVISQTSTMRSSRRSKITERPNCIGDWTSWGAFNHILYGMTQELQTLCDLPVNTAKTVLGLWACCLQKSEVAFLSKVDERRPKLGLFHKNRDSQVVYGVSNIFRTRKKKQKITKNNTNILSDDNADRMSNVCIKRKKRIIGTNGDRSLSESFGTLENDDIQSVDLVHLSASDSRYKNETGEGTGVQDLTNELITLLTVADYKSYKKFNASSMKNSSSLRHSERLKLNFFSKSKLLEIIHLALLLNKSDIQLSDLLRFIRESNLSYAKVTHFLPEDIVLSKGDSAFIETVNDVNMPTHLKQRRLGKMLSKSLGIDVIPVPKITKLVSRYCEELNLPRKIFYYSGKVLNYVDVKKLGKLKSKRVLPNFEGLAMAAIIFVMKLFFGLDDKTEHYLSDLAEKINRIIPDNNQKLFVFNEWQKHIECRKFVLKSLYYPMAEKLDNASLESSIKGFILALMKESKDDFKKKRLEWYKQYYIDPKLLDPIKKTLDSFNECQKYEFMDFTPSLTPSSSYLSDILNDLEGKKKVNDISFSEQLNYFEPVVWSLLRENYKERCINFVNDPSSYVSRLEENNFKILKRVKSDVVRIDIVSGKSEHVWEKEPTVLKETINFEELSKSKDVIFIMNHWDYWIRRRTPSDKTSLYHFRKNIYDKFPVNFRWLLNECAMLLEMNVRELFQELRFIEKRVEKQIRQRKLWK